MNLVAIGLCDAQLTHRFYCCKYVSLCEEKQIKGPVFFPSLVRLQTIDQCSHLIAAYNEIPKMQQKGIAVNKIFCNVFFIYQIYIHSTLCYERGRSTDSCNIISIFYEDRVSARPFSCASISTQQISFASCSFKLS